MKSNREFNLIIITLVMVIILVVGFIYDSNDYLLGRTLDYEIPTGYKIVKVEKHGMLYYRVAYEAKIRVDHDHPEEFMQQICDAYGGFAGEILTYNSYLQMEQDLLEGYTVKPNPQANTNVWIMGVETLEGHKIFHILCAESDTDAYLYVYYER